MNRVAVALVDSLLTAMVRANGDALVMHVGEKPIVVARSRSIDLSSHGLNLNAMVGMLGQLLPADAQASLAEFGAVEHRLPPRGTDHFTVVAARGGDDIWIEIRRRRENGAHDAEAPAHRSGPAEPTVRETERRAEPPVTTVAEAEPAPQPAPSDFTEAAAEAAPSDMDASAEGVSPEVAAQAEGEAPSEVEAQPQVEAQPDVPLEPFAPEAPSPLDTAPSLAPPLPAAAPPVEDELAVAAESHTEAAAASDTEGAATQATASDAHEEPTIASVSPNERVTTEAPTESPMVTEQEETAVTPDAEIPTPLTQSLTAPNSDAAVVDAHSVGAITAVGGPHTVPAMASSVAGFTSADAATSSAAPGQAAPPSSGLGAPPAVPAEPPAAAFPSASGGQPGAPVTRTVRIEVPSRATASRAASAERLLRTAGDLGATELFLMTQARPYVRVGGEVRLLADEAALSATELEALLADITPEPSRDAVSRGETVEWLVELAGVGRVRCASFRDHRGPGAIFHLLSTRVTSVQQLGLEADARSLASEPDGLVLVAGPAGSDKSAILSAFVDEINRHRADYMITIEPCVYLVHENVQALVSQREVGADADRAVAATRAALNENPDVLVVDNLASGDVAALAVEAASQGKLVLVSLEAGSTAEAVQRLIDLVPADKRAVTRDALARTFRGAVAQQLLRKMAGGRVAARELLMGTGAVSRVLADQSRADVAAAIEAARDGAPLADAVAGYVKSGIVDVREAFRKSPNRERLVTALRAAGVDTAAIDRLQ